MRIVVQFCGGLNQLKASVRISLHALSFAHELSVQPDGVAECGTNHTAVDAVHDGLAHERVCIEEAEGVRSVGHGCWCCG